MRLCSSCLLMLAACSSSDGPAPHEGPATCDSLCTRLEGCDALPDEVCFNDECSAVVCREGCADIAEEVRQDVLDDLQSCFDGQSCDDLAAENEFFVRGYDSLCTEPIAFDSSRAIPSDNQATCNAVRAAAETACASPDCERNVDAIGGNCETAARFVTPEYLTGRTECPAETECMDLHQCISGVQCPAGIGFDAGVHCPMQVAWDC